MVRSTTDCPAAAAVQQALLGLLTEAPPASSEAPDVAEINADEGGAVLRLRNVRDGAVAQKGLPATLSCADRAMAAAVIVAAWEIRLRGERAAWPAPPEATAPRVAVVPSQSIVGPTPPVTAGRAGPDLTIDRQPVTPRASSASPYWRLSPGAGLVGSVQGDNLGGGLMGELEAVSSSALSAATGFLLVGGHQLALGPGQVGWWRAGISLDGRWRRRWLLDTQLRLGVNLSRLQIEGRAFPSTGYDVVVDPGVTAGLRLGAGRGRWHPWLDVALAAWPRSHVAAVAGTNRTLTLPRLQGFLALGISFGERP
jgi:hypothetical protein